MCGCIEATVVENIWTHTHTQLISNAYMNE